MRSVPCWPLGNTGPSLTPAGVYAGRQDSGQGSPCPTQCWPRRPRGFSLNDLGGTRQPPSRAWKAKLGRGCPWNPTGGLSGQQPSHSRLFCADCIRPQRAPGTRRVSAADFFTPRPVGSGAVCRSLTLSVSWPP